MRFLPLPLLAILLLATSIPAQTPAWSAYGKGCARWVAPDQILNQRLDSVTGRIVVNLPGIGGKFGVMIHRQFTVGIYDCASFLLVGTSSTRWRGWPLPMAVPLEPIGMRSSCAPAEPILLSDPAKATAVKARTKIKQKMVVFFIFLSCLLLVCIQLFDFREYSHLTIG